MNKPKFVYVAHIKTTPEKLWGAITTTAFIKQYWFGRTNESEWKEGAVIESRSPEGELEWHGKILQSDPPRLLSFTFEVVGEGEPPSRVTFEIEPLGRNTHPQGQAVRLTVIHEEFPPDSKIFPGISEGWPAILSSLKSLLETGRSLELTWKE